ncbi:Gfo/Idh/MocA family oxidoreductase, partial [bacterium]|nr:Gfo/Idh/MocA family oxidoreductase [bacterium]
MLKKVKFGLIGCGKISKQHLSSISSLPDAELVAVCDIVEEKASNIADSLNIDWYKDYNDLLKRTDVDAVCVATPHGLHAPMAIDAAKTGKHVLMEKPFGLNSKEILKMMDVFKESGK